MTRLTLICGLPGAGKTTLARRLAAEQPAVRLCPDEWIVGLGGRLSDTRLRKRIEQQMRAHAEELLGNGLDVILEFGFWSRAGRETLRGMARRCGAELELRYLEAPIDELIRRLAQRDLELGPENALGITLDQLSAWAAEFEPPDGDELTLFNASADPGPHHTGRSGAGS